MQLLSGRGERRLRSSVTRLVPLTFLLVALLLLGRASSRLTRANAARSSAERLVESALDEAAAWRDKHDAVVVSLKETRVALEAAERSAVTLQELRQRGTDQLALCERSLQEARDAVSVRQGVAEAERVPPAVDNVVRVIGEAPRVPVEDARIARPIEREPMATPAGGGAGVENTAKRRATDEAPDPLGTDTIHT